MPIYIDSIKFTDEYTGSIGGFGLDNGADYLIGAVGDKMYAEIKCHVAWGTKNQSMTFNMADNTITREDVTGSFIDDEFSEGDSITISGAGANDGDYIITALTDTVITTDDALVADGLFGSVYIYGTTDIDYIDFYYNCISNSSENTFQSLTDVNTQKLTNVDVIPDDGTVYLVPATKQYAWVDVPKNSATVSSEGTYGYPTFYQDFKIVLAFFIKPFYLNGQKQSLLDLLNGTNLTPPEYFRDLDCLKFIYQIDARYSARDQTIKHTSGPQSKKGNTAWFNELLDGLPLATGGNTQFKLISTEYFDNATGNPVDNLDFIAPTDVQIIIEIPVGTSIPGLKFVVNFCWGPTSNQAYQNKGLIDYTNDFGEPNDFRHLFLHDRAKQVIAAGSVNGDRYGTDYQVITNVQGVAYGSSILITFTTDFGSECQRIFNENKFGRDYIIWITPESPPVAP